MEMKEITSSSEIRVGNWVQIQATTTYETRVSGIDIYDLERKEMALHGISMFGIPITENWLKRMGFDDISDYNIDFDDKENNYDIFRITVTGSRVWIASVTFVHQLQNLYFALTNTKLPQPPKQ